MGSLLKKFVELKLAENQIPQHGFSTQINTHGLTRTNPSNTPTWVLYMIIIISCLSSYIQIPLHGFSTIIFIPMIILMNYQIPLHGFSTNYLEGNSIDLFDLSNTPTWVLYNRHRRSIRRSWFWIKYPYMGSLQLYLSQILHFSISLVKYFLQKSGQSNFSTISNFIDIYSVLQIFFHAI